MDVDINTTEETNVEVIPDQLWLSANSNICKYPMIADLKDREQNTVTPFVIVNFSHHEHLHLPKDHIVAFAEKDCNNGEILEICTMEQPEKDLPKNWIPERKCQEKMSEFFENPFMKKKLQRKHQYIGRYFSRTKTHHPKHGKPLMNYVRNSRISYPRTVATLARPC